MRGANKQLRAVALALVCLSTVPGRAGSLTGELGIHDPSTIVECEGRYWVFGTARGISSRWSKDLTNWTAGPVVFPVLPPWSTNVAVGFDGRFWAPDVIRLRGQYLLYYSVSSWGKRESAIGLATSPTLDPDSPEHRWTDRGSVVNTTGTNDHNAIDPSVMLASDGRLWLAFGSYWAGIKLIELDPQTGLRLATNSPVYSLAWNESIEAANLYQHGNFYYLWVNWGQCCRGTNSTYEIRVGRSEKITGPYLDRTGVDLLKGGGSLFLASEGRRIGPGHAGIVTVGKQDFFSYHYYNADRRGRPNLEIVPLNWSAEGWPEIIKPSP